MALRRAWLAAAQVSAEAEGGLVRDLVARIWCCDLAICLAGDLERDAMPAGARTPLVRTTHVR